jgi:outer membrane protein assembly factor BamB
VKKQLRNLMVGLNALVIGVVVVGCGKPPAADPSNPVSTLDARSFAAQWKQDLQIGNNNRVSAVHLRQDSVYIYTARNQVYVLSRGGGTLQHIDVVNAPGTQLFPPVVVGERTVYPTIAGLQIYGKTGRLERSIELEFAIRTRAVGEGDRIYLCGEYPNGSTRLVAIDLSQEYQPVLWSVLMRGGTATAAPAYYDEVVYAGNQAGRVYAVTEDRNAIWPLDEGVFLTHGKILADVQVDANGVYFASTDTKLYCVDRTSGKVRWQYFSRGVLTESPAVTRRSVYQFVPGQGLVSIDKGEGKFNRDARWVAKDATLLLAEDDKYAYVRSKDNRIVALDLKTGQEAFRSARNDFDHFATNTADNIIFAATNGGDVYAIRPVLTGGEAGEMVMTFETEKLAVAAAD